MAWHFCSKANTQKMEKVQERALRFIYEDYDSTYDQLLLKAKTPSLEIKRLRSMAIECYKIIHDPLYPIHSDTECLDNASGLKNKQDTCMVSAFNNILWLLLTTFSYGKYARYF